MSRSAVKASTGPLSAAQLAAFERDGFVELPGVIPEEAYRDLILAMLSLVRARRVPGVTLPERLEERDLDALEPLLLDALFILENADHAHISAIYDTLRLCPALLGLVSAPVLCDAVAQLLGIPKGSALYFQQTACRIDVPQDTAFFLDWHQEVHYSFKGAEFIQLWAPLVSRIDERNGALRVLPGSHRDGVAPTIDKVPEFGHAQYTVAPDFVARFQQASVSMKRGSVMLFSKELVHASGVNSTARPRLTLINHYHNTAAPGFFDNIKPQKKDENPYKK